MPPKRATKLSRAPSPASIGGDSESVISEIGDLIESLSITDSATVLETALTKLLDRRASTRMEALESLNRQLSLQLHDEFLQRELVAIQSGLISSLKRNLPEETIQACHLLELITITIGSGADRLINDAVPILKSLSRHGDEKVRPAAIRALSIVQMITCHHADAIHHWMAIFARSFRRKDAAVASAAIDAWALLATKLPTSDLSGHIYQLYLSRLATLLHSQSIDVRTSAGEALALVFDAVWQQRQSEDKDEQSSEDFDSDDDKALSESESETDEEPTHNEDDSGLESDEEVDLEELHELLSKLATDGTRSRARKERSLQRSVFRSVDSTVKSGDQPKVTLKIGKERLTFRTWKSVIRLAAMREVLAVGFYRHISSNELVIEMLLIPSEKLGSIGDSEENPDSVSVQAKVVSQAKTKTRQQKKKADRNHKHSFRFALD